MLSRLKTALKRDTKAGPLSIEFDQRCVYTAGSTVSGVVHLQLTEDDEADRKGKGRLRGGATGRKGIDSVVVRMRVIEASTYQSMGGGGAGMAPFAGGSDFRNQRTMLLADEQVLWRSDEPLNPTPIASTSTDPAPLTRTLSPRSITSDTSLDESNMLSMVFSFRLPSYSDQIETNTILPPSFEGGSRSQAGEIGVGLTAGCAVGRVAYYISVVGMRSSRLVKDERLLKPFIYRPPPTVDPMEVPPPIHPAPGPDGHLPAKPASRPRGDEWRDVFVEKHVRMGGLFAARGSIRIDMTAPSMFVYPPHHPIPFWVKMTVRSPPIEAGDSRPPQLKLPSPSTLAFELIRTVETQAQGAVQKVRQFVEKVGDLANERRIWYGDTTLVKCDTSGEQHWSCPIVIVGEMLLGGEKASSQGGLSPSFPRPHTLGLGCSYSLTLHLPLKGTTSDFWVEEYLPLAISSRFGAEAEGDLLPAYFNDEDLDYEEEKK